MSSTRICHSYSVLVLVLVLCAKTPTELLSGRLARPLTENPLTFLTILCRWSLRTFPSSVQQPSGPHRRITPAHQLSSPDLPPIPPPLHSSTSCNLCHGSGRRCCSGEEVLHGHARKSTSAWIFHRHRAEPSSTSTTSRTHAVHDVAAHEARLAFKKTRQRLRGQECGDSLASRENSLGRYLHPLTFDASIGLRGRLFE